MKVHEYNEMMAYMLRPRQKFAIGGGVVEGEDLGSREGFSKLYGTNIRLSTTGANTFEVTLNRGGKNYYQNFKFDDYGGKEGALKAATAFRDSVKNIPKATGTIMTEKRLEAIEKSRGRLSETGKKAEIRKILNQFIAEGKTSFSNEDVRNLIDKDLFNDDDAFRKTVDAVKKESAFKNLNFIVKQRDRADFFTDPFIRNTIKENYKKLKQESLAKLVFPDEPLTTSKSRLGTILSDMADKGEIERLKLGEFSEERIQEFDPAPEAEKKAKVGKRRKKTIDILGSKDYEKELFNFKKEVQAGLGLEKIESSGRISGKSFLFDPIDMGHQSSIKQLKGLKQRLRPEDLNPQFYRANREGIQKYEGGVKTLEKALDKNFYPEQKKLYKQAQKFIDAGQEIPENLQNKIIKSNEEIQKFVNNTIKKYPLLKDRVNAITIDPINLNVKRGDNVFRQLGVGLVDKDLGDIKINSLDDLTIKANLAEQTLREAVDAGLIDEATGRQRLDKFLNVRDPRIEELLKIEGVTTADKIPVPEATKIRDMFKNAFKGAGKLGVAAVPAYYLGTGIKREISEGRNPFSMSAQAAETGEQTKEQNPSFIEEYPYLVGTTAAVSPLLTKTGRKIYGGVLKGGLKAFGSVPSGLGFSASQFVDINPFSDEFGELQEDPNVGLAGVDLLLPELGKRIPGSSSGILARAGRFALNPFQALEGLGRFGRAGRIAAMGARIPSLMTPVGLGLMGIEGVMMGMREQERINQMRETDPEAYQEFIADQEDMLRESAAYGGRMGFDEGGPSDPSKRKFMRIMGGLASLPVVGKFFRVAEQTPVVQNIFTEIQKLKNSETIMPDWFPTFLDKFRREGVAENIFKKKKVEVSKAEYDKAFAEGKGENYYTDVARTQEYKANNPDHMDYYKLEDTDQLIGTTYTNEKVPGVKVDDFDGEVSVNWENDYSQPVSIEYVKPGMQGSDLGRLDKFEAGIADRQLKPEGEFAAVDQEVYATDPDGGFDTNAVIVESLDDMMEGTTRVMEEYATGKPVRTLSKGEGKVIEAEVRAEQAAESAAEMADDFDDFE